MPCCPAPTPHSRSFCGHGAEMFHGGVREEEEEKHPKETHLQRGLCLQREGRVFHTDTNIHAVCIRYFCCPSWFDPIFPVFTEGA